MNLRRFNEQGISEFEVFLDSLDSDSPMPVPRLLLDDMDMTTLVQPVVSLEPRQFVNHFEVSEYLFERFQNSDGLEDLERDKFLWAWLALFYFDSLCPLRNGRRRPGERARWILNPSSRRYYRHLLAGPWLVYRLHSKRPAIAKALLCNPMNEASDVYLELVDNQKLISAPAIVEAVTRMYFDEEKGRLKSGTARDAKGGARRFGEVLEQFDCTWDFHSLSADDVLALLPSEFDKFRS